MEDRIFMQKTFSQRLLPVALSVLLFQLCIIANNLIVANFVGNDGLAVMSLVNPVYFSFTTIGALLSVGGATLAGHSLGKNNLQAVDRSFSVSLLLVLSFGVVFIIIGFLTMEPLLTLLGVPAELRSMSKAYLLAYFPGALAIMGIYIPFNYLKLVGKQNLTVYLFLLLALFNISLDLLFVLFFSWGITGVAAATSISFWLVFLIGIYSLCGKKGEFHFIRPRAVGQDALAIFKLGSPSATNNLCNLLRVFCLNLLLLSALGQGGLTAFSVVATVTAFSMSFLNGTAMTLTTFVGVFSGERDNESLRQVFRYALSYGLSAIAVFVAALMIFAPQLCYLFKVTDPQLQAMAVHAVRIFALSLLPALANFVFIAFHQSNKQSLLANILTVSRSFALIVLSALVLSKAVGGEAIWFAFLVAELLTLFLALAASRVLGKQQKLSPTLLLNTSYEDNGKYIAFSVPADNLSVAESAMRITEFCEQNELSPKKTMTIGLAIEEILVSFNKHALSGSQQSEHANVRILIHEDIVILRFRCGGKQFDPIGAAAKEDDFLADSMGIKMLQKLADTVVYTHTFGVNNLTITL